MKLNAQSIVALVLIIAVLCSAIALVSVRQMNRLAFYQVQKLERQRDDLAIEWRQLMAEFSTWRLEHNIESEVRGEHRMEPPASEQIHTIYLAAKASEELVPEGK